MKIQVFINPCFYCPVKYQLINCFITVVKTLLFLRIMSLREIITRL